MILDVKFSSRNITKKLQQTVIQKNVIFILCTFIEHEGNSKLIGKTINELTGEKKPTNKMSLLDIDGKLEHNYYIVK